MNTDVKEIVFEFNYASFYLTPYTGSNGTGTQLLKKVINRLNEPEFPQEQKIIDRNKNLEDNIKERTSHDR